MLTTTVVGNYPKIPNRPRPARLRNAIARLDRGEIGRDDLANVADEVTAEVIDEQAQAGLTLVTDGQVRWDDDHAYFARALKNVSINGLLRYFDTNTYFRQPVVQGPVAWQQPVTVRDYTFAAERSSVPVKAVLPGPYTLARHSIDESYNDIAALTMDFAHALHEEAMALAAAGAPVVQLNEPAITWRKQDGAVMRKAVATVFDGVATKRALYLYFGDAEGLYPAVLDLPVEIIGLDFVMGPKNYDVVRSAPFTKELGFGLIDARNTRMETPDWIATQLGWAEQVVPLDRVHLSPNTGLEFLPRETAQAKLARMVEGARLAEGVPA
jgi:5-methyltetrahydropteroyltriglutamate--homocysteine methyltransferase